MKSIKYYSKKKNQLMRAAKQTNDPKARLMYLRAFNLCDRMIGLLDKGYRKLAPKLLIMLVIVNLLVIATILSGCNTAKAGLNFSGAVLQDTGWAISKMSDNIQVDK